MKEFQGEVRSSLLRYLTVLGGLALLSTLLFPISLAQKETKTKYDVTGTWQGKFPTDSNERDADNPVAVEIRVKNDSGKISGSTTFYVIVNRDNKRQVMGSAQSDLLEPQFDGTTLTFFVKTKAQQANQPAKVEMRMRLTSDTEAELENLDDSSSPLIKMKKV